MQVGHFCTQKAGSLDSSLCVDTQEAGQADAASLDEEREAQEEVERLDSGRPLTSTLCLHARMSSAVCVAASAPIHGARMQMMNHDVVAAHSTCFVYVLQELLLGCCCQHLLWCLLLNGGINPFWPQ